MYLVNGIILIENVHAHTHECKCAFANTSMRTHMQTHVCKHIHAHTYTRINILMHTRIGTNGHTHRAYLRNGADFSFNIEAYLYYLLN